MSTRTGNAITASVCVGIFLAAAVVVVCPTPSASQRLPTELKTAHALEVELQEAYESFSRQVSHLSFQSPDYWRRVYRSYRIHELDDRWNAFHEKLRENAIQEKIQHAESVTGMPESSPESVLRRPRN